VSETVRLSNLLKPPGVTRLKLTGFRNYARLDLSLETRPVALFGSNGAGKTNLVEAVSFLGPGRGVRAAGADAVRRRTPDGTGSDLGGLCRGHDGGRPGEPRHRLGPGRTQPPAHQAGRRRHHSDGAGAPFPDACG
jgi:hypothetical protein